MLVLKLILINLLFIAGFLILLPQSPWGFCLITVLTIYLAIKQVLRSQQQQAAIEQTLFDGLLSLQDGDFSISLAEQPQQKNTKQSQLITMFNQLSDKLREEKQSLYHRELLLDKVVNASDVVTVLLNHRKTIIFANLAAKHFFHNSALLGQSWPELLQQYSPELAQHDDKSDAIIQLSPNNTHLAQQASVNSQVLDQIEQSWHLSRHQLKLHGSKHQLTLLKPMTKELHKQELQTWKKVIRVINHELNNSIAPISSMCHSGQILAQRINEPQLDRVFNTISNRIDKLSEFIQNYSQLARLSNPQKQSFNIINTIEQLQQLYQFTLATQQDVIMLSADESQIEQLLINLLKNAQEASSMPCEVSLSKQNDFLHITIRDHGDGMSQEVLRKALLPYFSTKAQGSGIGLSLCREVVEAHHGQLNLSNHPEGGLQVRVQIPLH